MRSLPSRIVRFVLPAAMVCLFAAIAQACPMCNQSIAEEADLPRAYMVSILFMLGMPATIFTGLGLAIYIKFRRFYASQAATPAPQ